MFGLDLLGMIMPGITKIIDKLIPDVNAAAAAKAQIQEQLIANEAALATSMQEVMTSDAKSDSKFTSNARPTVVYWSLSMITIISVFGIFHAAQPIIDALASVPGRLWDLITFGIGAFAIGRSAEKTATAVTTAVLNRRVK